jgi:hypothetical protein
MEVTCSSKTSVDFQKSTWRYIPGDRTAVRTSNSPDLTKFVWVQNYKKTELYFIVLMTLSHNEHVQSHVQGSTFLSGQLGSAVCMLQGRQEWPLLEDCNQATTNGGCSKLRRLVCVTVMSAVL